MHETMTCQGSFALMSPGVPGPPPHLHTDGLHEFRYELEGELEFLVGDSTGRAGAGSFAHVPPGVVHTFSNPGAEIARFIGVFSPAGGLRVLEDFATAFPEDGPPDMARIAEVFQQHGVQVVERTQRLMPELPRSAGAEDSGARCRGTACLSFLLVSTGRLTRAAGAGEPMDAA